MRGYIAATKAIGKPCNVAWFAKETEVWIERTKEPLGVVDGVMSETLELLSRPPATVPAA